VRFRRGEIDIVAWSDDTLVFVEVKCRRGSAFGSPQASVTRSRYERLAAAVASYMQERELEPAAFRIDVLAIEVDTRGKVVRSELIENVEPPASAR
jgi:putative endonuclease